VRLHTEVLPTVEHGTAICVDEYARALSKQRSKGFVVEWPVSPSSNPECYLLLKKYEIGQGAVVLCGFERKLNKEGHFEEVLAREYHWYQLSVSFGRDYGDSVVACCRHRGLVTKYNGLHAFVRLDSPNDNLTMEFWSTKH